jgi:hypothetical protein
MCLFVVGFPFLCLTNFFQTSLRFDSGKSWPVVAKPYGRDTFGRRCSSVAGAGGSKSHGFRGCSPSTELESEPELVQRPTDFYCVRPRVTGFFVIAMGCGGSEHS